MYVWTCIYIIRMPTLSTQWGWVWRYRARVIIAGADNCLPIITGAGMFTLILIAYLRDRAFPMQLSTQCNNHAMLAPCLLQVLMPLHHTPFLPDWVEHGTSSQHGWLTLLPQMTLTRRPHPKMSKERKYKG